MMYFATGVGVLFITFWIAQLVFARLHLKWSNSIIESDESDEDCGVSVIHPITDLDFELEKNLESWANQNYKGKVEHIFSFQKHNDPAIKVVEEFKEKHADMNIIIIIKPVTGGYGIQN